MVRLAAFTRWALLSLWSAVLLPLVVDFLKKWLDEHVYQQPAQAASWVISMMQSLAQLPWLVPTAWVMGGLTVGAWLDWSLRRIDGRRSKARKTLGREMCHLGNLIEDRQGGFRSQWPGNIEDLRPRLESVFIKLRRLGLSPLAESVFDAVDGARIAMKYLNSVGTLLSEGHFKEAKEAALKDNA